MSNIYWSEEELNDYLSFYDYSLQQFNSLQEIQDFLGTPINNDNLYDLLGKYNMQHNDLEILLAEYGEMLDDYKFIESRCRSSILLKSAREFKGNERLSFTIWIDRGRNAKFI
ncbi:processed acidic surface protein [Anaerobacillus sp. HL2]|nr:processed acidic surface protein [Anaerobacillus sp. HL2]